jgi:transposase
MAPDPKLTAAEWRAIASILPRPGGVGRPPHDDRRAAAELLFAEATGRFGRSLLHLYGRERAAFLVVRRARWREIGAWDQILRASHPAIARMRRREYGDCPHMMEFFAMSERA